jgi:hypothetical protein
VAVLALGVPIGAAIAALGHATFIILRAWRPRGRGDYPPCARPRRRGRVIASS